MPRSWEKAETTDNAHVPLATALTQYPILEGIVSHLRPNDLVRLTTICQSINTQIRMNEAQVRASLLTKTLCPGIGSLARRASHCPCRTRGWYTYGGCGGEDHDVESKPCTECGINTCNECRIHIVYQAFMEDPGLDNRRWWAGFVLHCPTPFALHPPKGMNGDAWKLPADIMRPHHDQGRFHAPLHVNAIADPEPLDRILDTNLGQHDITPWGRTSEPFDGDNVVGIFQAMADSRKELLCSECVKDRGLTMSAPCSCTLRKRFLDRWLCFPCYLEEHRRDHQLGDSCLFQDESGRVVEEDFCSCGTMIGSDDYEARCNWCNSLIIHANEDEDDGTSVDEAEAPNNHDEEDENAGPAPTDALVNVLVPVENKDGSLSMYYNGVRISGERLSRGLVMRWLANNGVELPCQCCKCPSQACDHRHHHHHHDSDSDVDEGEDENGSDDRNSENSSEYNGDSSDSAINSNEDGEDVEPELYEEDA